MAFTFSLQRCKLAIVSCYFLGTLHSNTQGKLAILKNKPIFTVLLSKQINILDGKKNGSLFLGFGIEKNRSTFFLSKFIGSRAHTLKDSNWTIGVDNVKFFSKT